MCDTGGPKCKNLLTFQKTYMICPVFFSKNQQKVLNFMPKIDDLCQIFNYFEK